MRFNPYEYQRRAIQWAKDKSRCCLFLDMGLGKSVITLTAIQDLIDDCEVRKALVVAPKKVAETTWTSEAKKWDHLAGLKVARVIGTPKQRREALASDADVYVIGRDSMVWLMTETNGKPGCDMIVIDELTSFKSPKSQRFKAMRIASATASRVVGLTGTPAPNGLIDLWAQIYCIDLGDRLGKSVTRYRDTYFNTFMRQGIVLRCEPKPWAQKAIEDKISDISLSMQASDYLQLPSMIEQDVIIELSDKDRQAYEDFEREMVLEVANSEEQILATSAAALMTKLSQFANGAIYDAERNVHELHEEKIARLQEIAESAHPLLVFYQYKHDAARITKALKGMNVRTYATAEDLEDWNAGKIDVLLAHPASTAYGLNMQQGGHWIVWFSTGWNLEQYQQANARLHRQGQAHPVTVQRLIVSGTVDERMCASLSRMETAQDALLTNLKDLMRKHNATQNQSNNQ